MPLDQQALSRLALSIIDSVPHGIVITDAQRADNPIVYCNAGFERLTGYSSSEILNRNCRFLQGPETDPADLTRLRQAVAGAAPISLVLRNYRSDRTVFWNALSVTPLRNDSGAVTHFVGIQTDVSEVKILEQQFRQSQKLEAMGQLTAGVAHDFNNLLTVIIGYAEMLGFDADPTTPTGQMAGTIRKAGERAASITRQLLAFTRDQPLSPMILGVNSLIENSERILRRLAGPSIGFHIHLAPGLAPIRAAASQIDQVLMNLVVNARDAMKNGGTITIETAASSSGDSVILSVSDTGHGIPAELREKIFEPFFTTKEVGKGTGLGLATVRRIVEENQGTIELDSTPGEGTRFILQFPVVEGEVIQEHEVALASASRGTEVVLVVEPDEEVRTLMGRALRNLGYTVLEAADGEATVRTVHELEGPLHLVIADISTPAFSPRVLADLVSASRENTRVLLVTATADELEAWSALTRGSRQFLSKPFSPGELALAVRLSLDRTGTGGD